MLFDPRMNRPQAIHRTTFPGFSSIGTLLVMLTVRGTFRSERAAWLSPPAPQPKTRAENCNGTELTYTDNLSAHGACIVSNHSWQPGEVAEINSMLDQIAMRGK